VLFSLTLLLATLQLIRKHRLREEYALVWFAASLAIFIFSVFDGLIRTIAAQFGVTYAPTLILVFGLLFCVVMLLAQTVMLSTQANRIRDLAQFVAMLDSRVDQAERGGTEQRNGYRQEVQKHQKAIAGDDVEMPELESK
jgi:hypothetical protein